MVSLVLSIIIWPLSYLDNHFKQEDSYSINDVRNIICEEKYIMHAGGYIDGTDGEERTYTNSVESFEKCIENKRRIIEVDFQLTSDNKWVCGHEGSAFGYWNLYIPSKKPLTYEEFISCKNEMHLTAMTLSDVIQYMKKYEDVFIITDTKDGNIQFCKTIKEIVPEMSGRFIIQIYHEKEYDDIKRLGFNNIIYTLYKTDGEERTDERLSDFVDSHKLVGVTMPVECVENVEKIGEDVIVENEKNPHINYEMLINKDVPIYVHTVNNEVLIIKCRKKGVSGFYTDLFTDI